MWISIKPQKARSKTPSFSLIENIPRKQDMTENNETLEITTKTKYNRYSSYKQRILNKLN